MLVTNLEPSLRIAEAHRLILCARLAIGGLPGEDEDKDAVGRVLDTAMADLREVSRELAKAQAKGA